MLATLFSAIVVFASTSFDYAVILVLMFKQQQFRQHVAPVVVGVYLGTLVLVAVSLVAAHGLKLIPEEWVIGLLGFIPIAIGVYSIIKSKSGDDDGDDDELVPKIKKARVGKIISVVMLVTLASGGDNVGVYIPYFSSLSATQTIVALIVFIIGTAVLCYGSYKLAHVKHLSDKLEKYEKIIVPVVYIALGLYILLENGTIAHFL